MDIGNVNQLNTRVHHVAGVVGVIAILSAVAFGCDDTAPARTTPSGITAAGTSGADGTAGTETTETTSNQPANNSAGATAPANAGTTATAGAGGASGASGAPTAGSAANQPSAGNGASGASGQSNVKVCVGKTASEYACNKAVLHKCNGNDGSTNPVFCNNGKNGETGEELCKIGMESGKCAVCKPESYRCTGQKLEKCDENGQWKVEETCGANEVCSAANRTCGQCAKGEYQCDAEGNLNICSEYQSEYELANDGECGSPALCDVKNKKCLECDPAKPLICDEREEDTLITCSADGKATPKPCSGATPRCKDDKCVQCKTEDDCESTNECVKATCNDAGSCTTTNVAARTTCSMMGGTEGVCSLGVCIGCIDNTDCASTEQCLLTMCTPRQALTVTGGFIAGYYTGTLNAGYELHAQGKGTCTGVTISMGFTNICNGVSANKKRCFTSATDARNFTVSGPTGQTCQIRDRSDSSVTLGFAASAEGTCDDCTVTLTAETSSK